MSLTYVTFVYYTDSLFSKVVLMTGVVFVCVISGIVIQAYIKREIVGKSRFPICHDLWEEFKLCARCKGFLVGTGLFWVMITVRNTIFVDLLKLIGLYPYLVVTFLALVSVPIHGALRRTKKIESNRLLQIVGLFFSSSLFLVGNLLVFLLYGF